MPEFLAKNQVSYWVSSDLNCYFLFFFVTSVSLSATLACLKLGGGDGSCLLENYLDGHKQ